MNSEFAPTETFEMAYMPWKEDAEEEEDEEDADFENFTNDGAFTAADWYAHSYVVMNEPSMIQKLWLAYLSFWFNIFGGMRRRFDAVLEDPSR